MADDCKKKVECVKGLPPVESYMFDAIAQEQTNAIAVPIELYPLSRKKSVVDPLYGEAVTFGWDGPFGLLGSVEKPMVSTEVRAGGFKQTFPSSVRIVRLSLEEIGAPAPRESDVVGFWEIPYWTNDGSTNKASTIKRYFFNVSQVEEDGFVFGGPYFTQFKLTLARNTEFVPERRVANR